MKNILVLCVFFLAACSTTEQITDMPLQPYLTATAPASKTPDVIVVNNTPAATSTPHIYTIKSGDTFSQLAEKFGISQDALRAANPDVVPNAMPVGGTLIIPDPAQANPSASSPTPMPAPVTQAGCHPSADMGLWCYALIQNETESGLANVSAQITLIDSNGNSAASKAAYPPLDIIQPKTSLPLYAFFPNTPAEFHPRVQVLTAFESTTYLRATIANLSVQTQPDQLMAWVAGDVYLAPESTAATQTWVAAVAYGEDGIVVGVKRWQGGAIPPGGSIPFRFTVSGFAPGIEAVQVFAEAKP